MLFLFIFILISCVNASDETEIPLDDFDLTVVEHESFEVQIECESEGNLSVFIDDDEVLKTSLHTDTNTRMIPTYAVKNLTKSYFGLGTHTLQFKFSFKNKTAAGIYSDDTLSFYFTNTSDPSYLKEFTFTGKLNIVEENENNVSISPIEVRYSSYMPIVINSTAKGTMNIYINGRLYEKYDFRDEEIYDKLYFIYGYYIFERHYYSPGLYNISFEFKNVGVEYEKVNKTHIFKVNNTTMYSKTSFNAVLNITQKEKPLYVEIENDEAEEINATYSYPIPITHELYNLKVYIDGKLVHNQKWVYFEHNYFIPTKFEDEYFEVGLHNLSFQFTFENSEVKYKSRSYMNSTKLCFEFEEIEYLDDERDYIYYFNTTLNIKEKLPEKIANIGEINITYTDTINITYNTYPYYLYNFRVFIDGAEVEYDMHGGNIYIKTYNPYSFTNGDIDVRIGKHILRLEFYINGYENITWNYTNTLNPHFEFMGDEILGYFDEYLLTFEGELNVFEKNKSIHIIEVVNDTYPNYAYLKIKLDNENYTGDYDDEDYYEIGVMITDEYGHSQKALDYIYFNGNGELEYYVYNLENDDSLNAGKYNITIVYLDDGTNDTAEFEIYKSEYSIYCDWYTELFDIVFTFDISLDCDALLEVDFLDKTQRIILTFDDDYHTLTYTDCLPGSYTARFYVGENTNYNAYDETLSVILDKLEVYLDETDEVIDDEIEINITSECDETIPVRVILGEETREIDLYLSESVVFKNLKNGEYVCIVEFLGNEKYYPHMLEIPFEINKTIEEEEEIIIPEIEENKSENESSNADIIANETGNVSDESVNEYSNESSENITYEGTNNVKKHSNTNITAPSQSMFDVKKPHVKNTQYGKSHENSKSYEISKSPSKSIIKDKADFNLVIMSLLIFLLIAVIYLKSRDYEEY